MTKKKLSSNYPSSHTTPTNVSSLAIEKFKVQEDDFARFVAEFFVETELKSTVDRRKMKKREDYIQKLRKKVDKVSKQIVLKLDVFFFNEVEKNVIRDRYKITDILKESTFSFVYQVS